MILLSYLFRYQAPENVVLTCGGGLDLYRSYIAYFIYKKTGPQHKPVFKTDVQIPNSKKVIGTGSSKKNAQQNAAKKLIETLKI